MDFLTKKIKVNEGEAPQYYVENSHPAIIGPEVFETVGEELRRRKEGRRMVSVSILSGRIVCGDCGGFYGRKAWHAGSQYAQSVWHCNNKFQKRKYCFTPTLKEEAIKDAFVEASNSVLSNRAEIFANYDLALDAITDDSAYRKHVTEIDGQCGEIETLMERLVSANAQSRVEQKDYNDRYNAYMARYNGLQQRRQELTSAIAMCAAKRVQIKGFLAELRKNKTPLAQFDGRVWQATLHQMKVFEGGKVLFVFRDGSELPWEVRCEVRSNGKKQGIPTYTDYPWSSHQVLRIISNEKYAGDCLLQKSFVDDNGKQVRNNGQRERYYIRNDHPAIVSRADWQRAQELRSERVKKTYPFSGWLLCPLCGGTLIRDASKWGVDWVCGTYMHHGKAVCPGIRMPEDILLRIATEEHASGRFVVDGGTDETKGKREKDYTLVPDGY